MTPPKEINCCPICKKPLAAMTQHLRSIHEIKNKEERSILLNLASGRINIRKENCPIVGCRYGGSRCDNHLLHSHPELTEGERKLQVEILKERVALEKLWELRATNPQPPMSSTLDLGEEAEEVEDLGPLESPPTTYGCQSCNSLYQRMRSREKQLVKLKCSYKLLSQRFSRYRKKYPVKKR